MTRFKVVITDFDYGDNDIERNILEPIGARVVALQAKVEDDLFLDARDCDAIMNQYARVGSKTISVMERCKVIARYGVGVDIVDVAAATSRQILVTNVRDYCTEEVADHAIAMWLTLARGIAAYDRDTHRGIWRWQSAAPLYRLRDRTVTKVEKDELLVTSDVVMMQVPMTDGTHHFLGAREFALIKPGAIVINTGRGPTIDNGALYDALVSGRVAAAGLDDPEEEPAKRTQWTPADNPLFSLPNVIVTPHAAYYSEESIRLAREIAASEVARVLTGQSPRNPVNNVRLSSGLMSMDAA